MTSEFILKKQSDYATPKAAIESFLRGVTPKRVESLERIFNGVDNEVYAVGFEAQESQFLRIKREGAKSFATEAWAMEQCRKQGVPVPEITLLSEIESEGELRPVMMVESVKGAPLNKILTSLSDLERAQVAHRTGEAMRRMHSVHTAGFYELTLVATDVSGVFEESWDFPDWESLMFQSIKERTEESLRWREAGLSEIESEKILELMQRYRQEFACVQPVLCHGDFGARHLFFDDRLQLSGIIDFGDFVGGPPILDFAGLHSDCPEIDMNAICTGYGDAFELTDRFESRLRLHALCDNAGSLNWHLLHKNFGRLEKQVSDLRSCLALE